jgi:hypothetical protein
MADCAYVLPAVNFVDECQTVKKGQVYKFYMTRPTTDDELTDVENLTEWETRLDQSTAIPGSGAAPIREFSGIGSWAAGETTDIAIPLDQISSVPGNKAFTFKLYDLTEENYAAIIALRDAGTTRQKIWTAQDDTIAGGNAGINGSMKADIIVPEGRTDLQYGEFTFTTKNSLNSFTLTPFAIL